jgi:hypothetical protein
MAKVKDPIQEAKECLNSDILTEKINIFHLPTDVQKSEHWLLEEKRIL